MPTIVQRHPVAAALAVLGVVFLVILGLEIGFGARVHPSLAANAPVKAAAVDAKLLPPIADAGPEATWPETGNRPLFIPTRRPAPAAEATATLVKGQFILQGVTILGDTRIAMLREKNGGKIHRIEKGRDVNGITVAEVDPEQVTLKVGGDSEVLSLLVQRPGGAPPPTPQGSATGPFGAPGAAAAAAERAAAAAQSGMPGAAGTPPGGAPRAMPGTAATPAGAVPGATVNTPGATTAAPGSTPGAANMTPEELLARRRARRIQQGQ